MTKYQKILILLAVIASLVFCIELTSMGLTKFYSVLAGGENYSDFATGGISRSRLLINFSVIVLNIVYIVWLLQIPQHSSDDTSFFKILKYGAIFLVIALISYPYSSDVYMYLQYGLMSLNGISPYLNPASSFTTVLSPFLHWSQTATYGPVSMLFFMAAALTVPISPILGVYVFKLFCVIVHGLNAYLIWYLLKPSQHRRKITLLYLLNPLLLTEHVAGAHVDVFVTNTLILLIGCLYYRQYLGATLALWLGFLTKTLPIIWLPLVINFLLRQKRWKELGIVIFLSLTIILYLSYTSLPTIQAWASLVNPGVAGKQARSLHHLLSLSMNIFTPFTYEAKQVILARASSLSFLGFAIYYIWSLLQPYLKKNYSEANLVSEIGWTTLVLFLFATPWLMPWYASVLLPIAALSINSPLFVITSLIFCLCSSIIVGSGSGQTALTLITSTITVGPAIVVLLVGRKFLNRIVEQMPLLNNRLPS